MRDLIQVPAPRGPRSSRPLEALFRAQLLVEEWEDRRRWTARAIIFVSLPMAHLVWTGAGLGDTASRSVFLFWAFAFAGWCVTSIRVAVARRMVDRLIASAGGRRVPRP